jgi:acyl-CoA thioesterase-1
MFMFYLVQGAPVCQGVSYIWRLTAPFFIFLSIFIFIASPLTAAEGSKHTTKLMIFGDSLSAGYGLQKQNSFGEKLFKALKKGGLNVTIIMSSVSGDTTASGKERLSWALSDKPDALLLELGANDGLRGIEPSVSYQNLNDILRRLKNSGTRVLLAGMLAPPNLGKEYGREFNQIYAKLAEQYNVMFYPFFLEGVATKPYLNQADGIHPNPNGVDEIVKRILPMVTQLIK